MLLNILPSVFLFSIFLKLTLIICVQVGQTALLTALDNCNEQIVRLLVERGASLDIKDEVSLFMGLLSSLSFSCISMLMIILCVQDGRTALVMAENTSNNNIISIISKVQDCAW
jgi:ankyrin repeat protein